MPRSHTEEWIILIISGALLLLLLAGKTYAAKAERCAREGGVLVSTPTSGATCVPRLGESR